MAQEPAPLTATRDGDTLVLAASGRWVLAHARRLEEALAALALPTEALVRVDASGLGALDTVGALYLVRLLRRLGEAGRKVEFSGLAPGYGPLLEVVRTAAAEPPARPPEPHPFLAAVERTGRAVFAVAYEGRDLLTFLGMVAAAIARTVLRPWRLRLGAVTRHVEQVGLDALPIVGLLSFLIGVVLAYQGADQLRRFGAELFVADLLGISILREIGVLMTAIIVAGRSGSAFTAQIGTMQVNQEVDAMRTLGLDPIELLVLPRLAALVVALPLLGFYAAALGLLGGAVMSRFVLDIGFGVFLHQLRTAVSGVTVFVGLVKAPVFAAVIALVGCYEGLKVSGSADSVGRLTTRSVVVSIFLVIVIDALFSILFSSLGL